MALQVPVPEVEDQIVQWRVIFLHLLWSRCLLLVVQGPFLLLEVKQRCKVMKITDARLEGFKSHTNCNAALIGPVTYNLA